MAVKVTVEITGSTYQISFYTNQEVITKRHRKTGFGSEGLDKDWEYDDRIESDEMCESLSDLSSKCSDVMYSINEYGTDDSEND
jgi:hypothetical protein